MPKELIDTHHPAKTPYLKQSDLELFWRALSLSERAERLSEDSTAGLKDTEILKRWCDQPPFAEHPGLLTLRLQSDGLDESLFRQLLSENGRNPASQNEEVPDWILQLSADIEQPQLEQSLPPKKAKGVVSGELLCLFEPQMKSGMAKLKQGISELAASYPVVRLDIDRVCEHLFEELIIRLASCTGRTLVLELQVARLQNRLAGKSPEARFESFVKSLKDESTRRRLFKEYPVLARMAVDIIHRWTVFGVELCRRLCEDWGELEQCFSGSSSLGTLIAVESGAGDSHREGRSVSMLEFSCGIKLVYKPRPVAVEVAYGNLLTWLNQRGFTPVFRVLKVLDRGQYGWVEFVLQEACANADELHQFYIRQGANLALLYLLEANDFHYENLIAAGEHPVLIDLETLFHPKFNENEFTGGKPPPTSALKNTVLNSGLLPHRMWTGNGDPGADLSGLGDVEEQSTPEPVLGVEGAGTEEMHYTRKTVTFPGSNNQPTLNGRKIKATDYTDELMQGFGSLYRLLLAHRNDLLAADGPLAAFAGAEVRVVFRETRIYAEFLMESLHPDVMMDALERDLFLDQLWVAAVNRTYLKQLIPFEHRDLRNLDIPLFTTRPESVDIWSASGERIQGVFQQPVLNKVKRKLAGLNEDDLARQQWIIGCAMYSVTLAENPPAQRSSYSLADAAKPPLPEALCKASCDVADEIVKLAFRGENDASWFSWKPIGNTHWDLEPVSADLYDGLAGIALFMAYLGQTTDHAAYTALARDTLVTARYLWEEYPGDISGIGAFHGLAGPIYLLTHLGVLWDDVSLLDEAVNLVNALAKRVDEDVYQDIIAGAAGAIVVLLNLYRIRPEQGVLDAAVRCGQRLIKRAHKTNPGLGWVLDLSGPTPLAGMSHGAAGIAWALVELAHVSGNQSFLKTAQQALAYERSLYSPQQQNWPDLRVGERPEGYIQEDGQIFMTGWCHGASGIGLARLAMYNHLEDELIREEVDIAINKTLASGFGDNHSLCHGDLGNLELLLTASEVLKRPELLGKADHMAGRILASVSKQGWISGLMYGLKTPGLMVGSAGIGYQLLRLAFPEQVPSVLSLEGPK